MALNKEIKQANDVGANYWNVGEKHEDIRAKTLRVVMFGYVAKETRDAGKDPAFGRDLTISGDDYKRDITTADIYDYVKKNELFEGATDA